MRTTNRSEKNERESLYDLYVTQLLVSISIFLLFNVTVIKCTVVQPSESRECSVLCWSVATMSTESSGSMQKLLNFLEVLNAKQQVYSSSWFGAVMYLDERIIG